MQELQARQREYQKKLQSWEEILRFWKDRAKRNNERYERRPLDLGFDPSFCPIYAQCKRSQSFTPIIDERLRQIKSEMLTASGIRENSLRDMIFVVEGPRRCHLEEQMQALEEQRPEEYRRSKAACLRAELRILADDQKHFREFFRELQTRNRSFFVPADLILQTQTRERSSCNRRVWVIKTSDWDGYLGSLAGTTMERALEWAEWVSRGAPRCERFWRGAFTRWCERGCARMHETNVLPIGTITLKGRWRRCKWEERSHQARSYISVHDAVNRAAQRIQRFFLVVRAKLTVASLRGETIGHRRRTDPLALAFTFASQAVTADYEGRFADACELYGQAVSIFVTVNSDLWSDRFLAFMRESGFVSSAVGKKYIHVFSLRMEELRRAVETDNAVLRAEQGYCGVLRVIARLKEEMELQARLLAAREEQQQLRRAARKEQKRLRYRTARIARKEQRRLQRKLLEGELQMQLTTQLSGEWETFDATDGTVFFDDLDVYMSGSDSPFLWFIGVDSNGALEYKYVDDEMILARLDGDTLTWGDGSVYQRVCDADNEQVHEVAGSMEISDETDVDDDVDDIPGGVRAVFVGGAYSWFVEDDGFLVPHLGHVPMACELMNGGYPARDYSNRAWLYHHYEYIKGNDFTAYRCGAAD